MGYRKSCMSSAVDGTDDGLWSNVGSECEEDEGTDCEGEDSDTEW